MVKQKDFTKKTPLWSVNSMREIRRKEKAITDEAEMKTILQEAKYVTLAMCSNNEPYLVTLSHGYDPEQNCIYIHCAREGKKMDVWKENNVVWGQALRDEGYVQGRCNHLYVTTQFKGKITILENFEEKKEALITMINCLEEEPEKVIEKQVTERAVTNVIIGRIDIEYMSGKRAKK